MAKLVFGMNVSLDGYVDHDAFAPGPALFRHFVEQVRDLTGSLYGSRMYDIMRYWDDDSPAWSSEERDFAMAWRAQPKWVVSRTLTSFGPNASLVTGDLETAVRKLKTELDGEIEVAGTVLAHSLTALGLIDEYRLYLHPVVLGHGKPYFAGPQPRLRLTAHEPMGEDVIRLTYVPA
ncbi:Dihydrofolate reductase [Dyella jiangningensis]|uniref:dihydrofolate reductase family protein n=1 Tax=Dyella sp. AtDHG13 TaxID=1938897 RepID=UPI00087F968F|nr:dihydrofolate reductase family protein [Dyella sp. AtDHG13]PXV59884.1 dihydrofolate reductase [Dyella sp. AtDHG13]SDJ18968.1 Dihydrofolate reductase [Dyella jiangningensis]